MLIFNTVSRDICNQHKQKLFKVLIFKNVKREFQKQQEKKMSYTENHYKYVSRFLSRQIIAQETW